MSLPNRNPPYAPFHNNPRNTEEEDEERKEYSTDRIIQIESSQQQALPQGEDDPSQNGIKMFFPYFSYKSFVFIISMVQIAVFLVTEVYALYLNHKNGFSCVLYRFGSKYTPAIVTYYQFQRFFLPIFLHAGLRHILMNLLSQFMFGFTLEKYHGTRRFMLIYFLSGIGGNLLSALHNEHNPSVGASSALFGVVALRIFYILENYDRLGPRKNFRLLFLGMMVLANIQNARSHSTVDNSAHIGGFIVGALLAIMYFRGSLDPKFSQKKVLAGAGLAGFIIATFVLIMMKTGLSAEASKFVSRCEQVFTPK